MSTTVDTRELVALERRFGSVPAAVRQAAVPPMHRVVLAEEANAKRDAKVDTGHFRRAITSRVEAIGTAVIGQWGSNLSYARAVEFGRKAGAKFPPKGVLVRSGWLRRHGIPDSAEFVIRRAIARRGIPAHRAILRPPGEVRDRIAREFGHLAPFVKTHLTGRS